MSKVQLIITIENDEQADKVLEVLNTAEEDLWLDFAFDVERREINGGSSYKTFHRTDHAHVCDNLVFGNRCRIQPTYTVGKDGEPMI